MIGMFGGLGMIIGLISIVGILAGVVLLVAWTIRQLGNRSQVIPSQSK